MTGSERDIYFFCQESVHGQMDAKEIELSFDLNEASEDDVANKLHSFIAADQTQEFINLIDQLSKSTKWDVSYIVHYVNRKMINPLIVSAASKNNLKIVKKMLFLFCCLFGF